ncbi:MAG: SoxR reducing system RseC family protein [Thermodesulfobacteriota bacterium]|nr:SoxR reducing system RseC family protein [Thermodesulfobacteriota bacterium]
MGSQKGTVQKTEGEWAWVRLQQPVTCNHCGSAIISARRKDGDKTVVKANNPVHAEVGKTVLLKFDNRIMLTGIFSMFVLPLIPIMLGIISGQWLAGRLAVNPAFFTVGFTVAGIVLALMVIAVVAKRVAGNPRATPTILRVVKPDPPGGQHTGDIRCPACNARKPV